MQRMEECVSFVNAGLPLSWLRLWASPLRLVSAAMWQIVQHTVVSDYGVLEEFVSTVTDIVPGLLSRRQRGQLILGLRSRLILELCRSEASADPQIIQPHLDRLHTLRSLWNMEADTVDLEMSDSHFLGLVQSLLRDPEDRENFFRDVFHEDFGPMYDKSIQKLMWHFLSRLEQLLPSQNFEQVASLLSNASSVLNESMETLFQPQELKSLLEYQNSLSQLEEDDSFIEDTCIMTALCLPPVERVVIVKQQEDMDAMDGFVYTGCTEIGVGSEGKEMELGKREAEDECEDDQQWFCVEVKSGDTEFVSEQIDIEPIDSQTQVAQNDEDDAMIMVTVGDGPVDMLDGVTQSTKDGMGKKKTLCENTHHSNASFQIPGQQRSQLQEMDCLVKLERVDMTVPSKSRPVRQNRGLKMKTFLSQMVKSRDSSSSCSNINDPHSAKKDNMDQRTCTICGKVLSQAKFLERHMNQHSTQQSYSCSECKRKYKSLRYLQEHKCPNKSCKDQSKCNESVEVDENKTTASVPETVGEKSEYLSSEESNTQDPSYSTSVERKTHKKLRLCSPERDITTSTGPFICPHCSVEFKCQQTLRYHLRNICYNEQQVDPERVDHPKQCFKCDECDKAFKYKSTLDSHKHTHNPLYCQVCLKLVRDSEALALHKISHTPFQCNLCEGNFPVFKALYKHYNDAHNPSAPFVCTHCQTTFVSLKRFIRHQWKHTGHQPFQCPHCPKRFRSYSDLLEHQKKHTKAYPFLCWECGKKFRHSITLTRHVQREHKPGQPVPEKPTTTSYSCAPCGKSFTSRWCFLKHDNFYHKGVRYPCTHCGKGFVGKDALVRHNLIHTGERPFKCDDCDKSFRSASELKVHRRYHTGERPFKCSVCDKGFVQSCFLTLHMRTHTGERPYICTVCGRGFASLHGLKRHTKLVHA